MLDQESSTGDGIVKLRRVLAVACGFLVLASACGGGDEPGPVASGSSEGLRNAFEVAGVRIIEDPVDSSGGLELWSYQVANMEREIDDGAGYLGRQLDELVGSPGGLPFSYLVAGWLDAAPTPLAEEALELIGEQPWEQAPAIVYPTAVLMLFVADGVQATGATDATAMATAQLASFAQSGVCSSLAEWFNGALDFVFDALKVEVEGTGGFFDWLGIIWNAALDLVRGVIEGLVELLTAEIVALIASGLAIIGTLSMAAALLQPWNLDLEPSSAVTRFALAGEPNVQEAVVATADPGYEFEWPGYIEDCASVAGLRLPNPTEAKGSQVVWKQEGFPELGSVTELEQQLDDENAATLDWVTAREDSDEGDENSGTVSIYAAIDLAQIEELKTFLGTLVLGSIPSGPFSGLVESAFAALSEPVFDALAELIRIKGTTSVTVIYHDQPEETTSTLAGDQDCIVGQWTVNGVDAAAIYGESLGIAAGEPYTEGSVFAEFRADGTVEFAFSGWIIGNRTKTESPIPGVISDLTGDTYTESNGIASGTWTATEEILDLGVGDFDTTVIQRIISVELEIDSTIEAIPDLARLYLIPGRPTRYLCNQNQLAIEWADGAAVRWFRDG
jgi:hypothetical protein